MESAAQHQPFVGSRAEAFLIAFVGFEIVGRHTSRRPVNQVGLGQPPMVHLIGRPFEHRWIVIHDSLIDAHRLNDTELVKDKNDIGEYTEMRSANLYYL